MMLNRPKPGSTEIAAMLRRSILGGELKNKERLPSERLLAERNGVSRGTVRDALQKLESEGLLEIRPGSGAYISMPEKQVEPLPIESARPLELMDARFALEPHMCRLAVLHATRADFEEMENLMSQMEAAAGVALALVATAFALFFLFDRGGRLDHHVR